MSKIKGGLQLHSRLDQKRKNDYSRLFFVIVGLLLHLGWFLSTQYTNEDAFITFRIARNLARGAGFTYNPPDRIYGFTTPLFTLLMAGWQFLWSDPLPGALLFNLLPVAGTTVMTYLALEEHRLSMAQRNFAMLILLLSSRLWYLNTMGMEMPWVLFFLAASWLAYMRGRYFLSGLLLGSLLLVRPDTLAWVFVLVITAMIDDRKKGAQMLLLAAATYLPWFFFAWLYFGSPIPTTITAKYWVHFVQGSSVQRSQIEPLLPALIDRLEPIGVIAWRTNPLAIRSLTHPWNLPSTLLSIFLLIFGSIHSIKARKLLPILAFLVVELARLTFFKQLFVDRYFIAAIWSVCLIIGLVLGLIWDRMSERWTMRWSRNLIAAGIFILALVAAFANARDLHALQRYRNEASLKQIGIWLRDHQQPGTSVQLEPLGYIGFYSNLYMLDEVGIVTPGVVGLKKRGVTETQEIIRALSPDAFVIHCDDMERMKSDPLWLQSGMNKQYNFIYLSDPLNFLSAHEPMQVHDVLARNACYEVWSKESSYPVMGNQ
jgi:hypothetical protein